MHTTIQAMVDLGGMDGHRSHLVAQRTEQRSEGDR
jgi:hypothetical protein